jgi:hypothetical protein
MPRSIADIVIGKKKEVWENVMKNGQALPRVSYTEALADRYLDQIAEQNSSKMKKDVRQAISGK